MAVSVRLMRQRRAGLAPSPSKEVEWVRQQLDGPVALPLHERLRAEKWVRHRSRQQRLTRGRGEAAAVQELAATPQTYTHIDLPTGKRLCEYSLHALE